MEKKHFERPIIKKLNAGMPDKFGLKNHIEPITEIDDVPINQILDEYGSPVYVVSEETIRKNYKDAYRAFSTRYPKVQFTWSYKTNYLDAVCRVFHQEGSWAEVVSGFEYEKALNNGIEGKHIIFNGPDKSEDDLRKAVENNSIIHIDHFDELYTLNTIADELNMRPKVAIRVNMDTGIYPMWDRFGFNYENGEAWDALNRIMISKKLDLIGLHAHIGTYMMTAEAYRVAASKLTVLAVKLKEKYALAIKYIDLGGGFASKNTLKGAYLSGADTCPSFDDFAEAITSALVSSDIKPDDLPVLMLETGRALIDDAGYLLGTVLATKRLSSGRRAMVIDIGINLLFTSFWYEHDIRPGQPASEHTEDTTIFGPLCMNIDIIRESMMFPLLKKGDKVVIRRIGAYNMTQWLQFITYRPNIIMVDTEGKTHLIRKAETIETFKRQEVVPDYLQNHSSNNKA